MENDEKKYNKYSIRYNFTICFYYKFIQVITEEFDILQSRMDQGCYYLN